MKNESVLNLMPADLAALRGSPARAKFTNPRASVCVFESALT